MLEYIFFNSSLTREFISYLDENKIDYANQTDDSFGTIQGSIISIAEDTKDSHLNELQYLYDTLQVKQENILESSGDALLTNVAGMEVALKNGKTCTIKINPEIVSKILTVISFEELQSFVNDITNCVQNPDDKPVCKK